MSTHHILCPNCQAVNRVPDDRDGKPNCGRCHKPLFAGPVALTQASFDAHLGKDEIPIVVDFWADWCGPCKMMAPHFAKAAEELEPKVRFAKVDTEAEQALAARYGIRSIPTMIAFKGGREVARQSGALGAGDIVRWVSSVR
ncbi:Thioredoxin 2 [Usitatibacter rugosus]|uniref:Thioredoxin n=1 Tax=Usitatibacter rugosus TaxID=2732067 RepID=A0A6M4GXU7_9PROT|nr:thioredoxin TrxC [Usitatibacter rugosus]QJR12110.1 Thioredoxin 2 [Usitatibacter rugosus]